VSRKTIPATAVPSRAYARFKRLSAALLIGSVSSITITVASAAGLFGDSWQHRSLRTWQQAQVLAERYDYLARAQPLIYWVIKRKPARTAAAKARVSAGSKPANGQNGSIANSNNSTGSSTVLTSQPTAGSSGGMVSANSSRPRLVRLPTTLPYVDRNSAAYTRFKNWVDAAVNGSPGYGFAAIEAALMYQLSPEAKYCTLAVRMVEQQVADAEATIAGGNDHRQPAYPLVELRGASGLEHLELQLRTMGWTFVPVVRLVGQQPRQQLLLQLCRSDHVLGAGQQQRHLDE
jgi:hypothetical protein